MALQRVLSRLEVDAHVLATLLFRFWSVLAGGITVLLIPLCLTSVQQGYYYTFASILALQVFFELGMGQVIVQIVAHEVSHLSKTGDGCELATEHLVRLAALKRLLRRWYGIATFLFLGCVNVLGWLFFKGHELSWQAWAGPWFLLVTSTACNLLLSWRTAVIEGHGLVKHLARLRLLQSMLGFSFMWAALLLGGGLWVIALVPLVAAGTSWTWLKRSPAREMLAPVPVAPSTLSWRTEILPFQWRIAISWISGFFIFQLFAPLIFKYHGAVEAGQVGLAITIFNSVVTVSTSWVGAKVPVLAGMIAQGRSGSASRLFRRLTTASLSFSVGAACLLVLVAYGLQHTASPIAHRLPSVQVLTFLAMASIGNSFVLSAAMFMRAHKEEPMLAVSVAMAIATSSAVYFTAPLGSTWVTAGYSALVWAIGVPWTATILIKRYYRAQADAQ